MTRRHDFHELSRIFRSCLRMNRASDKVVAQVSNLLYRRLPACGCAEESGVTVMATLCRLEIGDTAGWKPALRGTGRTLSVALLLNLLNPNCNFPKCKEGLD